MGSSVIEVGIGLILIYSVLSILVSQILNIIKGWLNIRGASVRKQLEDMLSDPMIRKRMMEHPSMQSLLEAKESGQTNVTTGMLADLMLDALAGNGETLRQLESLVDSDLITSLMDKIGDPNQENVLHSVLRTARNLDEAKDKLEKWFDDGMKRAGDLFQKRMQWFSFIVGLAVVLVLNIDTIYIGTVLWNDPVLREATISAAEQAQRRIDITNITSETEQTDLQNAQDTVQQLLDLRLPVGWYYDEPDIQTVLVEEAQPAAEGEESPTTRAIDVVEPPDNDSRNLWNFIPGNNPDLLNLLLAKLLGFAASTIAIMQGAPFWFDLLRRFTGGKSSSGSAASSA